MASTVFTGLWDHWYVSLLERGTPIKNEHFGGPLLSSLVFRGLVGSSRGWFLSSLCRAHAPFPFDLEPASWQFMTLWFPLGAAGDQATWSSALCQA